MAKFLELETDFLKHALTFFEVFPEFSAAVLSKFFVPCEEPLRPSFGPAFSRFLGSFASFRLVFWLCLGPFWVRFLGTFVDSKGLLRFVPSKLTSFCSFGLPAGL
jgi:hypothetical protein